MELYMQKVIQYSRLILLWCTALIATTPVQASLISVSSYQYNAAPSDSYPDSGIELTDGITDSLAWGVGLSIYYSDVTNLTGWLSTDPSITFNFANSQIVNAIKVFAADSNGAAGVALPSSILVSTIDGFSQHFNVDDPAGDGKTVVLDLTGFSTSSRVFTLTMARSAQWTMLSEVQFFNDTSPSINNVSSPALWLIFLSATLYIIRKRLV
jgi:hypothetical protein